MKSEASSILMGIVMASKMLSPDSIFSFANVALVVSLAAGAIATGTIVVSGNARDRALKRELGVMAADAANANLRASEANQIAEGEKLARLKIEERIAPRRLSVEQERTLVTALSEFKGRKVRLESYPMDVEGEVLAGQVKDALGSVFKIEDWIGAGDADGGFAKGVNVTGADAALVAALAHALRTAGLAGVSTTPLPPPTSIGLAVSVARTRDPNAAAVIVVGVKPLATPPAAK